MSERHRMEGGKVPLRITDADREVHKLTGGSVGVSRRGFLGGGGAAVIALTGFGTFDAERKYSGLAKFLDDTYCEGQYDYDDLVSKTKTMLKEEYGIDLVMGEDKEQILGDKVSLEKYRTTMRALLAVIPMYPPEMIRKAAAGRPFVIRVVDTLYFKDGDESPQRAAGVAPFLHKSNGVAPLGLDANEREEFLKRTLHHELNHRFADNSEWQERDRAWIALHGDVPYPYQRTPEGVPVQTVVNERYFLNKLASRTPIEDQAVCAEYMLTPVLHVEFLEKIRDEKDQRIKKILTAKYNQVKREYLIWGGKKFNEKFWDDIIAKGLEERGMGNRAGV